MADAGDTVVPKRLEEVEHDAEEARIKRDQEATEKWKAAAADVPGKEVAAEMWQRYEELSLERAQVHQEYAKAVVRRAAVYGWKRIAEEQDVSMKMLHTWRSRLLPEIEDLSRIPGRQMHREEKRIAELERRLEGERKFKEQLAAAKKRMETVKGAYDRD